MRHFLVIGIGTGNPEHVTVQAIGALNRADLVLIPRKGADKADLAELRRDICRRYLSNPGTRVVEFDLPRREGSGPYREAVADWHAAIAETYRGLADAHAGPDAAVALLVWGDPSLYDSTLRILGRLRGIAGFAFDVTVIPGITSLQALAAGHGMALNTVGGPVHVTTGRRLRAQGMPDADSVAVMLDGDCAFREVPGDVVIHWGAYLGMADEILISGPLPEVGERIAEARERARRDHGWIMDVYLLRRDTSGG